MSGTEKSNYNPRFEYFVINGILLLVFFSWRIFTATGALSSIAFWYSLLSAIGYFFIFIKPSEGNKALDVFWYNYDKSLNCTPKHYHRPTNEEEIVKLVKEAKANNSRLKVVGKGHSMNTIGLTGGEIILLDNFNKIINIDEAKKLVTVQAGITFKDLHKNLWEHGYSLPFAPFSPSQTVVGAIQTGGHSSCEKRSSFASLVSDITIVDGNGEVRSYSFPKHDEAKAIITGLGCSGIILNLSLSIEKAFYFRYVDTAIDDVYQEIQKLEQNVKNNEQYVLRWIPGTNICRKLTLNRESNPDRVSFIFAFVGWLKIEIPKRLASWALTLAGSVPHTHSFITAHLGKILLPVDTVVPSYVGFSSFHYARHSEVEFSVPRGNIDSYYKDLQNLFQANKEWKINGFATIQVVKQDSNILLSPFFGQDSYAISLSVISNESVKRDLISSAVGLFKQRQGRPIWSKYHTFKYSDIKASYPEFSQFLQVREKIDKDGLFLNDHLQRILFSS